MDIYPNFFNTLDTTEKIISVAVGFITLCGIAYKFLQAGKRSSAVSDNVNINNIFSPTIPASKTGQDVALDEMHPLHSKSRTQILFIDDDRNFKIVDILKKMGWLNTKIIKDVNSVEDPNILAADILFVDVQGVGKLLQFSDEGLGLALAVRKRYPNKKVVIYSDLEDGKRFHEALSEADYSLPKTAEPMRFEEVILKVLRK